MPTSSPPARRPYHIGLLIALWAMAGCGGDDRPPAHPTRGVVRLKGQPVAGAWVVLTAPDGDRTRAVKPFGKTGPDGEFRLQTYTGEDGAPAGEYAVTITWPGPIPKGDPDATEGPDQFRGRFADPKKPKWKVRIASGENVLPAFDLD